MKALAVFAAEVTEAQRRFWARVRHRPSIVAWFAILFAGGIWTGLRLAEIVQVIGLPPGFSIHAGTIVFLAFVLGLARGAVDGHRRTVRDRPLIFLWVQPARPEAIAWGKFLGIAWPNLALLVAAFALLAAFLGPGGMVVSIPALLPTAVAVAVVAGLAFGFDLAVPAGLSTGRRKVRGIASLAPLAAAAWFVTAREPPVLEACLSALAVLAVTSLALIPRSGRDILEAWETQTAGRRHLAHHEPTPLPGLGPVARAVLDKEWKIGWRSRDLLFSIAAIGLTAIALPTTYAFLGPADQLAGPIRSLLYPALVMVGIYLASAVVCAVGGLSTIGRELGAIWVLRVAPVSGREILAGKATGTLLFVPPILAAVAVPVPILAGLSPLLMGFLTSVATTVAFLAFAIGIFAGSRDPSFDPDTGGLPDSIGLYNVFLFALLAAAGAVVVAVAAYRIDPTIGLFVAILVADASALLAWSVTRLAGRRFERLELSG